MDSRTADSMAAGQAGAERSPGLRVAALQMVSSTQLEQNLEQAAELIVEAARQGAQLVALPEYFPLLGRTDRDKLAIREHDGDGPIQRFLSAQAAAAGIWIAGGTLPLFSPDRNKVINSCLVYRPDGTRAARYDKIHLFGFENGAERFDEAATIAAGRSPVVFDLPSGSEEGAPHWRVGLSICYDLRFPELYRVLAPTDLILVPSAFTYTTGSAHWEVLLRARAIENQCYVLAPAQGGRHENERRTWGHSMLVDPWGRIVAMQAEGSGIVLGDVRRKRLDTVRTSIPALRHRLL